MYRRLERATRPVRPWDVGCKNCVRCHLVIEGPYAGRCVYGGPFAGYRRYDVATGTLGPIFVETEPWKL